MKDFFETVIFRCEDFCKNWIYPAYYLRNLLFRRYDLVRLPGLKPQEYCDCLERMFRANMALVVYFMEKENPEAHVLWYEEDGTDRCGPKYGVPENSRLYLPEYRGRFIMDIITEIYHWYKVEYPAMLADSKELLNFWSTAHCGQMTDDTPPDENGLIKCHFDKSKCPATLKEIKAFPGINWNVIGKYLNDEDLLNEAIVRSRHTDLENRIFLESQRYLHLCIEVRPYLWT